MDLKLIAPLATAAVVVLAVYRRLRRESTMKWIT
jgi:hypothetical protein